MNIRNRKVLVHEVEVENGNKRWRVTDAQYGTIRYYKSAVNAQNAIKRDDNKASKDGISTITKIEWYPATEVGRVVVDAITGA